MRKILLAMWVCAGVGAVAAGCARTVVIERYIERGPDGQIIAVHESERPVPRVQRTVSFAPDRAITALVLDLSQGSVNVVADDRIAGPSAVVNIREVEEGDAEVTFDASGLKVRSQTKLPVMIESVEMRVPPAMAVQIKTGSGRIALRGLRQAERVVLTTNGGKVEIDDCRGVRRFEVNSGYGEIALINSSGGETSLKTGSGQVTVRSIELSDAPLSIHTNGGKIFVEGCTGVSALAAESGYGAIDVKDVRTPRSIVLRSGSGHVSIDRLATQGAPTLMMKTNGGKITVGACTGLGAMELETGYGEITVAPMPPMKRISMKSGSGGIAAGGLSGDGEAATFSATTNGGRITLADCSGFKTLTATTGYGEVLIERCGSLSEVRVKSGSGKVTVREMKPVDSLQVESNGGLVTADGIEAGTRLSLKTGYGGITVENTTAAATDLTASSGKIRLRKSSLGQLSIKSSQTGLDWEDVEVGSLSNRR